MLLLGGPALSEAGLRAAARIAAATGARLMTETFPARAEWGRGLPAPPRLPYFPEQARAALDGVGELVVAGSRAPVAFFGYPGEPSSTVPQGAVVSTLAGAAQDGAQDVVGALERLADRLRAHDVAVRPLSEPAPPSGALTPETLAVKMCAQRGRIGVISPEGGLFAILAGRYSSGVPNLDLVLWPENVVDVLRLSAPAFT